MVLMKTEDILKGFEHLERDTRGPDLYVVRAIKMLVHSNARVEKAVDDFKKTTLETEGAMRNLTKVGITVAVVQAILAVATIIFSVLIRI